VDELFEGRHFDREIIILCVRWYLRFKLSLRDLVEMMAERGLSMAHTTIMRWVQCYAPEFAKRWRRFAEAVGRSWRVDENLDTELFTHPPRRIVGRDPDEVLAAPRFPIALPRIKNGEGPHSRYLNAFLWTAWQSPDGAAVRQGPLVSRGS
jgi:hypothetical protein